MKNDYYNVFAKHRVIENGEDVIKTHTYRFKKSGVTFPFNSMHKLIECRKSTVALFYYLCEVMDKMQTVTNNKQLRLGFNKHLKQMGSNKQYSDETIYKGFNELRKVSFLISTPNKGMCYVNPRHAYRSSASIDFRKKLMNYFLELLTHPEWDNTNLIDAMGRYSVK